MVNLTILGSDMPNVGALIRQDGFAAGICAGVLILVGAYHYLQYYPPLLAPWHTTLVTGPNYLLQRTLCNVLETTEVPWPVPDCAADSLWRILSYGALYLVVPPTKFILSISLLTARGYARPLEEEHCSQNGRQSLLLT
jgi:hypothetical protein